MRPALLLFMLFGALPGCDDNAAPPRPAAPLPGECRPTDGLDGPASAVLCSRPTECPEVLEVTAEMDGDVALSKVECPGVWEVVEISPPDGPARMVIQLQGAAPAPWATLTVGCYSAAGRFWVDYRTASPSNEFAPCLGHGPAREAWPAGCISALAPACEELPAQ